MQEANKKNFIISTDKRKLNMELIHDYLCNESYWAKNIPVDVVRKSIEGSCCFGLYINNNSQIATPQQNFSAAKQVGFGRVVTDYATFGYLADVFIIKGYRGEGLAHWLMEEIMKHSSFKGLRRWMLATKDAHGLYAKFGFLPLDKPERIMGFKPFEVYPETNS